MLDCWLAGVLDFCGKIGVRLGRKQLQPYIAIYSRKKEYLVWLREIFPEFSQPVLISKNLHMSQVVSIRGTLKILRMVAPHLYIQNEVSAKVVNFCEMRLTHLNEPYNLAELQLIREVVIMTSRRSTVEKRLAVLEQWL